MNVLIVDDSAAIRKILQRVLGQAKVPIAQVFEAGDGVEALEVLKNNPVSLVLSDINMPNMDGLQLLEQCSWRRGMEEYSVRHDHDGRQSRKGSGGSPAWRQRLCSQAVYSGPDQGEVG